MHDSKTKVQKKKKKKFLRGKTTKTHYLAKVQTKFSEEEKHEQKVISKNDSKEEIIPQAQTINQKL